MCYKVVTALSLVGLANCHDIGGFPMWFEQEMKAAQASIEQRIRRAAGLKLLL
jgi:hypothetical protein